MPFSFSKKKKHHFRSGLFGEGTIFFLGLSLHPSTLFVNLHLPNKTCKTREISKQATLDQISNHNLDQWLAHTTPKTGPDNNTTTYTYMAQTSFSAYLLPQNAFPLEKYKVLGPQKQSKHLRFAGGGFLCQNWYRSIRQRLSLTLIQNLI